MLKRFAFIAALVGITCCGSTTSDGPDSPDTPTTPTNPTTPTAVVGDVSINVMTFNIRYDNTGDGQNIWANRRDRAANAIKFYSPDLFGTQETLHNQLEDLKSRLPEYGVIGVGREDGKEKGEYSPVWYKKDRFSLQSSGYFWLSETPDVAGSKGWDGACERIATWAIFKDKYTNNAVFFINTHLDHQGVVARREGVNLLFQKITDGQVHIKTPARNPIRKYLNHPKPFNRILKINMNQRFPASLCAKLIIYDDIRIFKKKMGMTPVQYRKGGGNNQ